MQRVAASFVGILLWCHEASAQDGPSVDDLVTLDILMNVTTDVVQDTSAIVNDMEGIRIKYRNSPDYECGYLNKVLEEFFRKQVNLYNTSKYMNVRLYTEELVLYLEEIEHHYWQIEHVGQMLHEVERKHKIGITQANCQDPGDFPRPGPQNDEMGNPKDIIAPRPGSSGLSPELGRIFGELSWASRIQLLDQYYPTPNKTILSSSSLMQRIDPNSKNPLLGPNYYQGQTRYTPVWPPSPQPPKLRNRLARRSGREVGLAALKMPKRPVAGRRQTLADSPPTSPLHRDDDTSMKLKLFRLMYETVRDSDLKVKRAELIKTQYVNSSAFEVGYLLGDISDKYSIMSDIALTLKRLYMDWRPIEHINAYEQIANQAIEISHLIDLAKTVHKRNEQGGNDNNNNNPNNKNNNAP